MFARRRSIGALLSLVFVATAILAPAPVAAADPGPLPACSYQDVLTARTRYADFDKTLLDPIYMLPSTYVPPDLVYTSNSGITGGGRVRNLAIADLRAMQRAARNAGKPIAVSSAYRSYTAQANLFASDVNALGYDAALLHTARPGHSEHQLGTTIDFKSKRTGDTCRRRRLGQHQGRPMDEEQRLEIRLGDELPQGQDRLSPATSTSRGTTATSAGRWRRRSMHLA